MEVEVPRNFRQNSCELKVKNMKFKAKAKNNKLVLKVSATGGEAFNENAVSQFTALGLNAFLPATKVSKKTVQFEAPVAITLAKRLVTPVGGYDFLSILEQIILANRTLTANNFPIFHMAMTTEKVFFVEETGELKFIYTPLEAGFTGENMIDFINSFITMAKPADSVANDVILRFGDYFRGLMPFHIDTVESFVEAENPHVVEALRHLGPATQAIDTDSDDTVILDANAGFVPDSDDTVVLDSGVNYGTRIEEIAEREGVIFADENSAEAFEVAESYEPVDLGGAPIEETEPLNMNENADFGVPVESVDLGGAVPVQPAETYEPIDLNGAVPVQPAETYEPVDLSGAVPVQPAETYEPVDLGGVPIDLNNGVGAQTEQGFTGAIDLDFNSPLMTVTEPLDDASAESAEPITEKTAEPEPVATVQPTVEPEPIPEPVATVQPTVEPEPISEPEPIIKEEPETIPEPEPVVTAEPEPEPVATVQPTVEPEPVATVQPTVEPEPIPEPVATVQPTVEPEPEPISEPEPVITVQPTVEPETTPEPVANITVEPEVAPEPVVSVEEMNGAKTEDDFYDAVTEVLYTPPATPPEKKGRLVQAVLVVQSTGQKAVINSNKFIIGKSLGCDLTIKNSNVSREHATIFFDGMDFYVADNASTNGTHLNGQLLSPNEWYKITVDDRLSLANEIVDFLIEEREQ